MIPLNSNYAITSTGIFQLLLCLLAQARLFLRKIESYQNTQVIYCGKNKWKMMDDLPNWISLKAPLNN